MNETWRLVAIVMTILATWSCILPVAQALLLVSNDRNPTNHLLLVGNSYTSYNNLANMLQSMLREGLMPFSDDEPQATAYTVGGQPFFQHYEDAQGNSGETNRLFQYLGS